MDSGRDARPGFAAIPASDPKLAVDPKPPGGFPAFPLSLGALRVLGPALSGSFPGGRRGIAAPGSSSPNCSAFWGVLLHAGSAGSFLRVVERIPRDPAPGRAGTIPKSPNPVVCAVQLLLPELRCRERFPGNPAPELPFPSNPAGGGGRGAIPVLEEHRDGVKCPWDFLETDPRKRGKTGGKAWRPLPVESF